jgi:hypothetical protein
MGGECVREILIRDWDELQRAMFDGIWDDRIMRYRANRVYRGMADKSWGLTPSLNRVCAHDLTLEASVIRSFRKYAYADLAHYSSIWQILSLAQHHGLPTRLLDWTYSPLVAAHFATEDVSLYDRDGAIFSLDVAKTNALLPARMREALFATRSHIFSVELLDQLAPSLEALRSEGAPYALFFEPASMLDRIINQYALFSVTSEPGAAFDDIFSCLSDCAVKLIIPKYAKLEIRDKLDYINISERMIYPGLDGICKWITRRYAALGPAYNRRGEGEET